MFVPTAHSQAVANLAYIGSSYGYACVSDINGTAACLADSQNYTLAYGNYTLAVYIYPSSSYVFSHWITQGNITVGDIQGNNTLLEVNGNGILAAVFLPSSQSQTGNVKFSGVRGFVCFLKYANSSGPVCLMDGQNTTLPAGRYIAEASPYNVSDSFVKWSTQGKITVDNQSSYITNVTVSGNGVLGLVYAKTIPTAEATLGVLPTMLAGCLGCTLLLLRRKKTKHE
jgi:hypothetical protein